jgi:prepilin-type processing-associated H-X9-DG protein
VVRPTRGDYAVSAGVALTTDGQAVPRVDPKQIFIIDYYPPAPVADYTGGKDDMKGTWNLYFFEDPQEWLQENAAYGTEWKPFQALRHFGKANVLFCDGHVEPLGLVPEDDMARTQNRYLYATNPLWQFRGQ